jgi:pimeloyl-ACP methyl ester carboxylesterase
MTTRFAGLWNLLAEVSDCAQLLRRDRRCPKEVGAAATAAAQTAWVSYGPYAVRARCNPQLGSAHALITPPPSPIVLVHGAWGGAWIWRRVIAPLRAAGREVHAATLTGCGDRAHLLHPSTDLFTHIQDVVALVEAEELDNITLVGHSYAGQVITGVADRLTAQQPRRIAQLVYVDAMVPLPGEGWGSNHAPELVAKRWAAAQANGNTLPPPNLTADSPDFGLSPADNAWLQRCHVPHPFGPQGPYRQALPFDAQRWAALPRSFIDCNQPAYPTIASARERVRQQSGWRLSVLPTGHFPMLSMPGELVGLLLEAPPGA